MDRPKEKTLIFACNGVSPTGQMTTQLAFDLEERGIGKVGCLSGIGSGNGAKISLGKEADRRIALDGCNLKCALKILENAGIKDNIGIVLADAGLQPPSRKPSKEEIERFAKYALERALI